MSKQANNRGDYTHNWIHVFLQFLLLGTMVASCVTSATTVTFLQSHFDEVYSLSALKLALENTRDEYGDFDIKVTPEMSVQRALERLDTNAYPNAIRLFSPNEETLSFTNVRAVAFPVRLGVMGYRVCAHRSDLTPLISKVRTLKELMPYVHVQGVTWADINVLRFNRLQVKPIGMEEFDFRRAIFNMYSMISQGEADLFCRAAHEAIEESYIFDTVKDVKFDTAWALYYRFPFLFHVNNANKTLAERVKKGLVKSYKDGSLLSLWDNAFGGSLRRIKLTERKIVKLKSPWSEKVLANSDQYDEYFYIP